MFSDDDNNSDNPWENPKVTQIDHTKKKKKNTDNEHHKEQHDPLSDLLSNLQQKVSTKGYKNFGTNGGAGGGQPPQVKTIHFVLVFLGCVLIWLATGIYQVEEGSQSVVLRFGTPNRVSGPGLNYRFPSPFETNYVLKTQAQNRIQNSSETTRRDDVSFTLTGDENMISTNYVVLWRIKNIKDFLFTNKDPEITIRAASESAMREVIGQKKFPSVLTENRTETAQSITRILQNILDGYQIGVEITSFELQSLTPPAQVSDSFQDMQTSSIDAERMKREAEAYANDIIPRARGNAVKIVEAAKAYSEDVIARARGEAAQFNQIYNFYKENRSVASKRYYLEGMQKILDGVQKITVIDESLGKGTLPHLSLNSNGKD